jgi:hypothetical protein
MTALPSKQSRNIRNALIARDWHCDQCGQLLCLVPQCMNQMFFREFLANGTARCRTCITTEGRIQAKIQQQKKGLYASTGEKHTSPFEVLRGIVDAGQSS